MHYQNKDIKSLQLIGLDSLQDFLVSHNDKSCFSVYRKPDKNILETYNDACNLVSRNSEKFVSEVSNACFEDINIISNIQKDCYDISGYGIDIGRYLDDIPECFYAATESERKKITLIYDFDCCCQNTAESISRQGIILMNILNCLHCMELSIELKIRMKVFMRKQMNMAELILEDYSNLSLSHLAFLLSPAMDRRFFFRALEYLNSKADCLDDNYGSSNGDLLDEDRKSSNSILHIRFSQIHAGIDYKDRIARLINDIQNMDNAVRIIEF